MKLQRFFIWCTLFLTFLGTEIFGQSAALEAGIFLGGSTYRGDVVAPDVFTLKDTRLAYGVFARYPLSQQWQFRANILMTKLSAEDQNYQTDWNEKRAFQFSTFLAELSVLGEWHPFGLPFFGELNNKNWSPYLFTGVGFALFSPKPDFNKNTIPDLKDRIAQDESSGYNKALVTIPFGAGVRFKVNKSWSLTLEGGARPAFTDYLDGISQAGQSTNDDWYGFGGILLGYTWIK